MTKIYVAGKDLDRARSIMNVLRSRGHEITYDWVAEFSTGPTREKAIAEREGVCSAEVLIYLWEPDQESARYEAGMAMGLGKPVIVSGKSSAFFFQLPDVYCVESDEDLLDKVEQVRLVQN